ncbi:MAG: TlpA disulfide reductase family protein [Nitrospinota bacterium]
MKKSFLSVLFFLITAASCMEAKMEAPAKTKPFPAPEFSVSDLEGKKASIAEYKGKPLIINFWATWCVPCIQEMPELEKLYKERKKDGLELLMINAKESKEVVSKYIKEKGYTFRVLIDEEGKVLRQYQVFGLPSTFFIDDKGVVQYFYMGQLTWGITKMGLKSISVIKP